MQLFSAGLDQFCLRWYTVLDAVVWRSVSEAAHHCWHLEIRFSGHVFLVSMDHHNVFSQTGLHSSDIPCNASRIPVICRRENLLGNICFINSFENMTEFKMSSTKICDICNSFESWPFKGSWDKGFISNLCICDSCSPQDLATRELT